MFAWGTSGYKYNPDSIYHISGSYAKNHLAISGNIEYTRYDWGYYNAISNAENNFAWRTLNSEEWEYLLDNHDWYFATINDITGIILLPEEYDEPVYISHVNGNKDFTKYIYNLKTWELIENQGAVFLPNGGIMTYSGYTNKISYDRDQVVRYWTSTLKEYKSSKEQSSHSYAIINASVTSQPQEHYFPVRLVRDVE